MYITRRHPQNLDLQSPNAKLLKVYGDHAGAEIQIQHGVNGNFHELDGLAVKSTMVLLDVGRFESRHKLHFGPIPYWGTAPLHKLSQTEMPFLILCYEDITHALQNWTHTRRNMTRRKALMAEWLKDSGRSGAGTSHKNPFE